MTHPVQKLLLEKIQSIWHIESLENVTTILAISGGPDSVALAHLLSIAKPKHSTIVLAHFNHQLRAQASDEDAQFVRELADQLGFQLDIGLAKDPTLTLSPTEIVSSNQGEGLESIARQQRYEFLMECAKKRGARFIATAHTLDDHVETVVQRFFRGTSINGLKGIQPVRELVPGISLVRPLLRCRKKELVEMLESMNLNYRIDQSNYSSSFTRNRIRNELLPLVDDIFENNVANQVVGLSENAGEVLDVIHPLVDQQIRDWVIFQDQRVTIDAEKIVASIDGFLISELLVKAWKKMDWPMQQMNREKWNSLVNLVITKTDRKINLPGNILAEKRGRILTIWDGSADRNG